ncbi:hypothetical protein H9P43_008297 [Blastocladiella emersonii ATCC 22665]|nr:hypothetical protein H9P43_008297 [Blastocladiella emersonii ATCC 22665]
MAMLVILATAVAPTRAGWMEPYARGVVTAAASFIPSQQRLYLFGGFDSRGPIASSVVLDLSQPFPVDAPNVQTIASLPLAASWLIPNLYPDQPGGTEWSTVLASGWVNDNSGGGGTNSEFPPNTNVWAYSLPAGSVVELKKSTADFRSPARSAAAVPLSSIFTENPLPSDPAAYCFGGFLPKQGNNLTQALRVIDKSGNINTVNPSSGPAPSARYGGSLIRYNQTHLVLSGGTGASPLSDIWLFNIPKNTWSKFPKPLSSPQTFHQSASYLAPSGRRYVINVGANPLIEVMDLEQGGTSGPVLVDGSVPGPTSVNEHLVFLNKDNLFVLANGTLPNGRQANPLNVLQITETAPGSLAFKWLNTYIPPGHSGIIGPTPVPETTSLSLSGFVIFGISVAVGLVALFAFLIFRRRTVARKGPDSVPPSPTFASGLSRQISMRIATIKFARSGASGGMSTTPAPQPALSQHQRVMSYTSGVGHAMPVHYSASPVTSSISGGSTTKPAPVFIAPPPPPAFAMTVQPLGPDGAFGLPPPDSSLPSSLGRDMHAALAVDPGTGAPFVDPLAPKPLAPYRAMSVYGALTEPAALAAAGALRLPASEVGGAASEVDAGATTMARGATTTMARSTTAAAGMPPSTMARSGSDDSSVYPEAASVYPEPSVFPESVYPEDAAPSAVAMPAAVPQLPTLSALGIRHVSSPEAQSVSLFPSTSVARAVAAAAEGGMYGPNSTVSRRA